MLDNELKVQPKAMTDEQRDAMRKALAVCDSKMMGKDEVTRGDIDCSICSDRGYYVIRMTDGGPGAVGCRDCDA